MIFVKCSTKQLTVIMVNFTKTRIIITEEKIIMKKIQNEEMSSSWPQNEYSRMFREIRNMPKYSLWIASCTENITFLRIYINHKIAFKVLHIVNGSLFAFFLQRVHVRDGPTKDLVSRSPIKCKQVVSPGTIRFTFTLKLPIYLSINSIYLIFQWFCH